MSCEVYEFVRYADQEITVKLFDPRTAEGSPIVYINAGTVSATLYNENDDVVLGPLSLTYVALSDGEWKGLFESNPDQSPSEDFDAPIGDGYYLEIKIESDTGASLRVRRKATVVNG